MGKRQDFIDLYKSGQGTRQKYIDLSGHGFRKKSTAVPIDPLRELMIYEMLMSGALPSELKHGGIASLAPRSGYARGGWSPGAGRDERGYQSSHPSYGGGGGDGQGVTTENVIKSPIIDTGRTDYNFNLGNESLSPSFSFKYSPAKAANLRARIYNQNLLESDDVNVEGDLSGTIGPVDYNTQFTDQGFGNTNLNYGNFSATIDPNKNYNLGYQTNRDGVNTGARYDSDGNLMFTAGIKFNKGGLAGILEV